VLDNPPTSIETLLKVIRGLVAEDRKKSEVVDMLWKLDNLHHWMVVVERRQLKMLPEDHRKKREGELETQQKRRPEGTNTQVEKLWWTINQLDQRMAIVEALLPME